MRKLMLSAVAVAGILMAGLTMPRASQILVGECYGGLDTCSISPTPTPWSDDLTLADLTSLGLGTSVPLVATQTTEYVIQLGATSITFDTNSGSVTDTLPEYSGGFYSDPGPYQPPTVLGEFVIPADALSAVISGTFGSDFSPNSSGVEVCLGSSGGPCGSVTATPLPSTWTLLIAGIFGLGFLICPGRRKNAAPLTAA
jgi:hypothetical protein